MGSCGNPFAPQYHFNGNIDDVRIYNRALSEQEVAGLYQLEAPEAYTLEITNLANGSVTGAGSYENGATATLTATPDPGYLFTGWSGDASGNTNPLAIVMEGDRTVGASFEQDQRDPDGDGLSNWEELVVCGTDPDNPDTDGDGAGDGVEKTENTDPTDARTFPTRLLTVSDSEDGTVTGAGIYPLGEAAILTATPALGYLFSGWTGDAVGDSNPLSLLMNEDRTVRAIFGQDQRDPDQDGLSNYEELVVHGTNPDSADSDGDGFSDGLEVAENSDPNQTGTFPTRVLTVVNTVNGSVTGAGIYPLGSRPAIEASPALGFLFTGWTGDASGLGTTSPASITMNLDRSVGAIFSRDQRDPDQDGLSNYAELVLHGTDPDKADSDNDGFNDGLEVAESSDPNGTADYPTRVLTVITPGNGTVTGGGTYPLGTGTSLTATPAPGHLFTVWTGDASGNNNPLALIMYENQAVGAIFDRDQRDPDGDGLTNYRELVVHRTNPNNPDSDGDGFNDGLEVANNTDPNDPGDLPNQAPEFADQIFELFRGSPDGTVVGILAATDQNNDQLIYSLVENTDPNGNGRSAFRVTGNQLVVNDAGDFSTGRGIVPIAAGYRITMALREDGTVAAWGRDNHGQASVPEALDGVVSVSTGVGHSVALRNDGTVVAWGRDNVGQRAVPNDLDDAIAISAGENHSLAVRADGTVVAWGDNESGQADVPVGLAGVVNVAAGRYHSLALLEDGTVVGWGSNSRGQSRAPTDLTGVTSIAAGEEHSVALREDGTVVAWGRDNVDQASVPVGLAGITAIAAGRTHNVALREDGTVVEWGENFGSIPQGLGAVSAIAAGSSHSVALLENGALVTWGRNENGETVVPEGITVIQPDSVLARSLEVIVRASDGLRGDEAVVTVNLTNSPPSRQNTIPLSITKAAGQEGPVSARWASELGKTYRVEISTDLVTWSLLESGIAGTGAPASRSVPSLGGRGFVRVREE